MAALTPPDPRGDRMVGVALTDGIAGALAVAGIVIASRLRPATV